MDVTGGEGWTLHPRLDQEEEAREGKVCCDAKKTISEAASCLAQSPSRSVGQWQRCVRTMAAAVETWARQSAVEIVVENKEGMNILGRPVAPTCRTDPDTIALETAIELCNIPFSGGSFPSLPSCGAVAGLWHRWPLRATWAGHRLGSAWQGDKVLLRLCSAQSSAGQGRGAVGPLFIVGLPATAALRGVTRFPCSGTEPAQASRTIRAVFS